MEGTARGNKAGTSANTFSFHLGKEKIRFKQRSCTRNIILIRTMKIGGCCEGACVFCEVRGARCMRQAGFSGFVASNRHKLCLHFLLVKCDCRIPREEKEAPTLLV